MSTININKAIQRILLISQRWNSGSRDCLLVYIDKEKGNGWSDVMDVNLITPSPLVKVGILLQMVEDFEYHAGRVVRPKRIVTGL